MYRDKFLHLPLKKHSEWWSASGDALTKGGRSNLGFNDGSQVETCSIAVCERLFEMSFEKWMLYMHFIHNKVSIYTILIKL